MAAKKPRLSIAEVRGFGRKWKFVEGTEVKEALRDIGQDCGISSPSLKMVVLSEIGKVGVGMAVQLVEGYDYVVERWDKVAKKEECGPVRRFAAGNAVNPQDHYFVIPSTVEPLLEDIKGGKYCVLCGPRQSGKTTAMKVVGNQLKADTDIFPVFFEGLEEAARDWRPSDMWKYLWSSLHRCYPSHFGRRSEDDICLAQDFRELFMKGVLKVQVAVIFDEADSLLLLSVGCLNDFFNCIRTMKQDRDTYNLKSFVLVGVETVKDLLEAQYDARRGDPGYIPGTTPSRLSPFPHDHSFSPGVFKLEDVVELLEQRNAEVACVYNAEHQQAARVSMVRDVGEIAASIMQQTSGHRGLVGTCLAYLVQEKAYDALLWRKLTSSYKLANYVFGQGTYNSMMQRFRGWVSTDQGYKLLVTYLEEGEQFVGDLRGLRNLLAEGALAVKEEIEDGFMVDLSSPLLRTAILRKVIFVNQEVEKPPGSDVIDRVWLLLQAVKTLDGEVMCRPECLNARGRSSSEYSHQFLFMSRLKAILRRAYPGLKYVVLPEAKEVEVPGVKRSEMRLDTLLRDGPGVARVAFELVVDATEAIAELHQQHAQTCYRQHSAQVFLINFTRRQGGVLIKPKSDGVFSFLVQFNEQRKMAIVYRKDVAGKVDRWEVPLIRWTGQLSFEELVG